MTSGSGDGEKCQLCNVTQDHLSFEGSLRKRAKIINGIESNEA